jgi:hypothetical protein
MRIKCAAIRHGNKIYEGTSHSEIGLRMIRDGVCTPPYPSGDDQGFVTECGRYVRRAAARAIAIRCGQVSMTIHPRLLFSEDLRNLTNHTTGPEHHGR